MFGLGKARSPVQPLACLLSEYGYTLVAVEDGKHIRFCEHHHFNELALNLIAKGIAQDVERYNLYGHPIQIILSPGLYQLLLMDALDVAEDEMAKAIRWQLKGMIDFPLNDIAIDTFLVPPHGAGGLRKTVFVAVTPQIALINKVDLVEHCFLKVSSVSIAELALANLLPFAPISPDSPTIVVSYDSDVCRLHVFYEGNLYLSRVLSISKSITQPFSPAKQDMVLEIQRSIDYCLIELKLPEPKKILFTPSFYEASDLFSLLQEDLEKEVYLLDVNAYFTSDQPIAPEVMAEAFYAIGGAMMLMKANGS